MSQTLAKTLDSLMRAATAPLSARQRDKTVAAFSERLSARQTAVVETKYGPLKFQALRSAYTASAIARFFDDEPDCLEWIDTTLKAGDVLWDIGANIGLYSLYASQKEGLQIFSFEPSAFNFALLVEHVAMNKRDDVVNPLCIALSDTTGIFPLHMANLSVGRAGNGLQEARTQEGAFNAVFKQSVPALRGDDAIKLLGIPAPTHIKLDVDGIEGLILAGMPDVLKQVKTVMVEVEGENEKFAAERIDAPLVAAGLHEDIAFRAKGNPRNRLFTR